MRAVRVVLAVVFVLFGLIKVEAQTEKERYEAFRRQARQSYESFRDRANQQYAEFMRQAWERFHAEIPEPLPFEKQVPPEVCPDDDRQKTPIDEPKPYEEVTVAPIVPDEQPQPIDPVEPMPHVADADTLKLDFYGTDIRIAYKKPVELNLQGVKEKDVSEGWESLSSGKNEVLLASCLNARNHYKLNDWGYMLLLDKVSEAIMGVKGNDATLLMGWLFCQSGYKMRMARSEGRLFVLFASKNVIYDMPYVDLDEVRYYPYGVKKLETLDVCKAFFPKEQTMTLAFASAPFLKNRISKPRILRSERYPKIEVETTVNLNLVDFYNDYPSAALDNFFGTRWAMYADTPLSETAQQKVYPKLRQFLEGKSELEAVEELLNFVQTSLVYEYDSIVWGRDRAFFAEETLFYPYADCEDRSILFSRLVRDLLGLEVVLLYYPDHLATAVKINVTEPVGDYLQLPDGKYFVADPTYIGASVGMTMPPLKDAEIKVIRLRRR